MVVLGLSSYYHDSSACLTRDGNILAAAQEERFSRQRNTDAFPIQAVNFCVQKAGVGFDEIDVVAFYEKPFLKFSRVLIEYLATFPFSFSSFMRSMPKWLDSRLTLPLTLESELGFKKQVVFFKHHLSHAASAFLPSPFERAAILTCDGVGEWATLSRGLGEGTRIRVTDEIHYPDSLGLLYTAFTTFLGFNAHGGEGKTMGLAGYGEPTLLPELKKIVKIYEDGSFRVDQSFFSYRQGTRMWSRKLEDLFGPARQMNSPYEQRHYDLAASVQKLVEKVILINARVLQKQTQTTQICLAGGVALNCLANHKILEETDFQEVFIQPAAGDAGGALGAALYAEHGLFGNTKRVPMNSAFLGPEFSDREILRSLSLARVPFQKMEEPDLLKCVAQALFENQIVGWFQGSMEFGPRALGHRSILANPGYAGIKDRLNNRIKNREPFRPFAPVVAEERARDYFELRQNSPYMLLATKVRPEVRNLLPGITHVDGTARVQTANSTRDAKLYSLLKAFEALSGYPILINTSFNRNGEPVVCHPDHAIDCFQATKMDVLAIGNYLVTRPRT